jgi:hypothetical protein
MRRSVVGLLAAVGATMSASASLVHGDLVGPTITAAGAASGLAAYMSYPDKKNASSIDYDQHERWTPGFGLARSRAFALVRDVPAQDSAYRPTRPLADPLTHPLHVTCVDVRFRGRGLRW